MNKKVAIVGTATSSRDQAPYGDMGTEIWGLAWRPDYPRCDVGFDLHTLDNTRRKLKADYPAFVNQLFLKVYFQEKHKDVPVSERYPIEEVIKFLAVKGNGANGDYFASTISYMFALAMYQEYDFIGVFGADMIAEEEYGYQRPNMEYLIGLARGMGIKVYIPPESSLLKFHHRYAYESWASAGLLDPRLLRDRLAEYTSRHNRAMAEMYTADGAAQATRSVLRLIERGGPTAPKPKESEDEGC